MQENLLNTQEHEAVNSASSETFFETEKSMNETKIDYCTSEKSIMSVALDELEAHPLNQRIYIDVDSSKVKSLAQNIKDHTLINRIIINRNLQILSGNLRFKALKLLNISQIEAYVIDLPQEDELEFIISSNQQRVKTILDARNEIISLFEKYSPGQGNKESKGENTIKKISYITGYSTSKISSIRRIDACFPSLLNEIDYGNMTLNSASKKCDLIDRIRNLSALIGEDLLKDLPVEKIEETFDKGVKAYCEKSEPEYCSMLKNNEISTTQTYAKLFPNKKSEEEDDLSGEYSHHDGLVDDSMYCPCCSQKVKTANKEIDFLRKWNQKIIEFVVNLKYSANE
jgi:hypothetical protein